MNTFGNKFRISIFGESHGSLVGVTLDGVLPGIPLSEEDFVPDYSRIKHSRNKSKAVSSSYRPKHNSSFGKGRRSSSYKKKLREEESSYSLKKGRGHKSSHNKGNKSSYNKSRSSSKNSKKNNSRKIHY